MPDLNTITLTAGTLDCDARGHLLLDIKHSNNNTHSIKAYNQNKQDDKYDYALEGEKKILKFFNDYVIEVKTEKGQDKIQIYDFDNKLCLYYAAFPQIF